MADHPSDSPKPDAGAPPAREGDGDARVPSQPSRGAGAGRDATPLAQVTPLHPAGSRASPEDGHGHGHEHEHEDEHARPHEHEHEPTREHEHEREHTHTREHEPTHEHEHEPEPTTDPGLGRNIRPAERGETIKATGAHPRVPQRLPEEVVSLPPRRRGDTLPGLPVPETIRSRVKHMVHRVQRQAETGESKGRTLAYLLRMGISVIRQWARDRCPQQAASLAFQTVLSIVPLVAVTLAVLRGTGSIGAESSFVHFLATQFIPVSPEEISKHLLSWSENINFQTLGAIGLASTVLLAFITINSTEKVINHIWRAERRRSIPQKFVVFYATATIAPFLIGTWLYQAIEIGWTTGFNGFLLSCVTSFVALFLANYFLPACPVRIRAALIGALVSTILFEAAKHGFNAYVYAFAFKKYAGIYGAVAIVPLWLLWIYYSWLMFLLGVEVAHAAQNMHLLQRVDRRRTMTLENELLARVNGMTAARIMVEIARGYIAGEKAVSRAKLQHQFDLSTDVLTRIATRLKEADLLIEVQGEVYGYVPARPPNEITLSTVLDVFRGDDVTPDLTAGRTITRLDKVLAEIEADMRQRTARLTLDQLVR